MEQATQKKSAEVYMIDDYFEDKKSYDCYTYENMGIFVPVISNRCKLSNVYEYPCYEVIIDFNDVSNKNGVYSAIFTSPGEKHTRKGCKNCYIVLIEKEYFEDRYKMYKSDIGTYNCFKFDIHIDILKNMNSFIYEITKQYPNAKVVLEAQTEIIIHWIIRSLLGETYEAVAISSNYSVAKAQQYMEQHYMNDITVKLLSDIGCMSETTFNRHFKKETGITPIEYLLDVRIRKSKDMLRRNELSITEIAMSCGFNSVAYFSSCFANRVNASPQEYRNSFL